MPRLDARHNSVRWAFRIFDDARFFLLQVHFPLRSGLRNVTVRAWGPLESKPGWKNFRHRVRSELRGTLQVTRALCRRMLMLAFAATMCMGSCSRAWSCFLHISQRCGLLPADAPKAVIPWCAGRPVKSPFCAALGGNRTAGPHIRCGLRRASRHLLFTHASRYFDSPSPARPSPANKLPCHLSLARS